ncbi:HAD-IA family hydrolase [Mycolicibacterium fortuitum]|nr:HAD-IA family hydrolase [Mycolicibacterium fortuitum]NOP95498.1 HAD-IA family hydrolase [Mycolicibacterium fortuitum]UBV18435.1 HAD-IA family hydrolase [Mycolicibacterium fortuitum]
MIFDVDGTLSDTERDGHRPAFNEAFAIHGLGFAWNEAEYGDLLKITGGRRRIAHDLRARGIADATGQLAVSIHRTKTDLFCNRVVDGQLSPRPGLGDLVADLRNCGTRIAIATTGSRRWVQPLVDRLVGAGTAEVMVTGDDVAQLKPDPEVYLRALHELRLGPKDVLAVEDSAVGLQSARAAGLATVVVTNDYTRDQDFSGAAAVLTGYHTAPPLRADRCRRIHRRWWNI